VPFDGTDYAADAGFHNNPNPNFLKEDPAYYYGIADVTAKAADGQPVEPKWENGKPAAGYFVLNIPDRAVDEAGGWGRLIDRGRQQFNVHCAACHGTCGRGGKGDAAYGIVGGYDISVAPANLTGPRQFYHSCLFGHAFALDVPLGALFWVLIHHVSDAGWSVGLRRVFENVARAIIPLTVLFIPVLVGVFSGDLHAWYDFVHGPEPAAGTHEQHLWHSKHVYFATPFFLAR